MSNWKYTDFRPTWAGNAEDREFLSRMPDVGHYPDPAPSVSTRILPTSGRSAVSASTLSEAITIKQRIFHYAAYEVVHGIDPTFSDMRRIDDVCLQLGKLEVEPFEEGSFIIPAELNAEPVSVPRDGTDLTFRPVDVLNRFNEVITGLGQISVDMHVSIGMLTEIGALNRLLRRDVQSLEFTTNFPQGEASARRSMRHIIDEKYLGGVNRIRKARRHEQVSSGDTLTGTLVAVDFESHKLRIKLDAEQKIVVPGTYLPLIESDIVACMRKRVRYFGQVWYRDRIPWHIDVLKVDPAPC